MKTDLSYLEFCAPVNHAQCNEKYKEIKPGQF